MRLPDWQLPTGVDRGLWDYMHATEMVASYDEQLRDSPLAAADVAYCERAFPRPGRLLDLGCGTGRLCAHFLRRGYSCVGVDLSAAMLEQARVNAPDGIWLQANLVELDRVGDRLSDGSFDYAACLFSTLGMIRGAENRRRVLDHVYRLLKPGGRLVLHGHNRFFRGLGSTRVWQQRWKSWLGRRDAGDITMSQPYGGAPLTLHHFTRRSLTDLVRDAGLTLCDVYAFGDDGRPACGRQVYGWLILGVRQGSVPAEPPRPPISLT